MTNPRWWPCTGVLAVLVFLAGCATPIGVSRVGQDRAYGQITANVMETGVPSADSLRVLRRYHLEEPFKKQPSAALRALHDHACKETRRDVLFALAELSYAAAKGIALPPFPGRFSSSKNSSWTTTEAQEHLRDSGRPDPKECYAASVVYAYLYLFSKGAEVPPDPFDRRFRVACDLYNRSLARALTAENTDRVDLTSRQLRLPSGVIPVESTRPGFRWNEQMFHEFIAADDFAVRGISSRTRESGLGVPLITVPDAAAFGDRWPEYINKNIKVPATAFLRVEGTIQQMNTGGLKATLELYCPYNVTEVKVDQRTIPLETDLTAPLAYGLQGGLVWKTEFAQFFSGQQLIKTGIYLPQPYEHGKIPVLFVHGTTGSPARWAEMFNTLQADPTLRTRCQFWYFIYNSGQPIAYSAMLLREAIDRIATQLDPEGKDPALKQMVVIGHSQGSTLTRMMVVSSGDRLWASAKAGKFEEAKFPPETRSLLRRALFFEPSPYVTRAVFLCGPFRGSIMINNFVQNLSARLIQLPGDVMKAGTDLLTGNSQTLPKELRRGMPTAIANMKPGSQFEHALLGMPFKEGVALHSIIAVKPGMDIKTGNDGVVAYTSAHLDNADSEFVVRWSHSCQDQAPVIEEVRRILLLQVEKAGATP